MIQYVRGRIGEDRGTILDMGRIPGYDTRFPTPSAPLQGQKRDPGSSPYSPVSGDDEPRKPAVSPVEPREPAPKRSSEDPPGSWQVPYGSTTAAGVFLPIASAMSDGDRRQGLKRLRQHENDTTVTNSESFSPLTPDHHVKAEATPNDMFMANVAARLTT